MRTPALAIIREDLIRLRAYYTVEHKRADADKSTCREIIDRLDKIIAGVEAELLAESEAYCCERAAGCDPNP